MFRSFFSAVGRNPTFLLLLTWLLLLTTTTFSSSASLVENDVADQTTEQDFAYEDYDVFSSTKEPPVVIKPPKRIKVQAAPKSVKTDVPTTPDETSESEKEDAPVVDNADTADVGQVEKVEETATNVPDEEPRTTEVAAADDDGDGIPNYLDDDVDGDGVMDDGLDADSDGDGIPDHLDIDRDGDGIDDEFDDDINTPNNVIDTDGDGIPDMPMQGLSLFAAIASVTGNGDDDEEYESDPAEDEHRMATEFTDVDNEGDVDLWDFVSEAVIGRTEERRQSDRKGGPERDAEDNKKVSDDATEGTVKQSASSSGRQTAPPDAQQVDPKRARILAAFEAAMSDEKPEVDMVDLISQFTSWFLPTSEDNSSAETES